MTHRTVSEIIMNTKVNEGKHWISVDERLPDRGEFVLIHAPACEGTMFVGIRDEETNEFWYDPTNMSYLELKYAPHWMPLPAPPAQGESHE